MRRIDASPTASFLLRWKRLQRRPLEAVRARKIGFQIDPRMKSVLTISRWVDALWGYDVFIAHRRADAAAYARAVYDRLMNEKISCFIDQVEYGTGDSLLVATRRHVTKSTILFLVGSPDLQIVRSPIDWVEQEIQAYLTSHHKDPKVIVVDFGSTIANTLAHKTVPASPHQIFERLRPFLRIPEDLSSLSKPPSEEVLSAVRKKLDGRRRERTRLWFFEGAAAILMILLIISVLLGLSSERQRRHAEAGKLVGDARANLASHPATQTAILQARAALLLNNSVEARNVSSEIMSKLARPVAAITIGPRDGGALLATLIPDGTLIFETSRHKAVVSVDKRWNVSSKATLAPSNACGSHIHSANGQRIACTVDRHVRIRSTFSDTLLFDHEISSFSSQTKISLDYLGNYLAIADEHQVATIETRTGIIRKVPLPSEGWPPSKMSVSSDGRYVALAPSSISIGAKTPAFIVDMHSGGHHLATEKQSGIAAIAFALNSNVLAIGAGDGHIDLFNPKTNRVDFQFQSLPSLRSLVFSNDGRFLAAGAPGGAAVYSHATGSELAKASTGGPIYDITFDSTDTHLVTAGSEANELSGLVIIWNLLGSADFSSAFNMSSDEVLAIGFDADNHLLQSTVAGMRSVDLKTGDSKSYSLDPEYDANDILAGVGGHKALLLGHNVFSNTYAVRDLAGTPIGPEFRANTIATTPDGKAIAALGYRSYDANKVPRDENKSDAWIGIWRESQREIRRVATPEDVDSIAIDSAGQYVVVTSADRRKATSGIRVYSGNDLTPISSAKGRSPGILVAVAPDGRTVVSADGNKVSLHQLPDLKTLKSIETFGVVQSVTFSSSGAHFSVIDDSGTIAVYHTDGRLSVSRRLFFDGSNRRAMAFSLDDEFVAVLTSVSGVETLKLIPLPSMGIDKQLCERILEKPTVTAWGIIVPSDPPPRPCENQPLRLHLSTGME